MARNRRKKILPTLGPGDGIFVYVRASSEDDRQETSTEVQLDSIRDWAARKGLVIRKVFEDRLTSATPIEQRPGFRAVLRELRENPGLAKALVCKRIDRCFRDNEVMVFAEVHLNQLSCLLIGIDDPESPDGAHSSGARMVRTVLVAVGQMQRELTGEMVKDKQIYKFKNGLHHSGKAPFGYVSKPKAFTIGNASFSGWVPDEEIFGGKSIADWVRWIFNEAVRPSGVIKDGVGRAVTSLHYTGIACYLNDLGVPTPSKLAWLRRSEEERRISEAVKARQKRLWEQAPELHKTFRDVPYAEVWEPTTVAWILKSPAYVGEVCYNGDWIRGLHTNLIDRSTFEAAQLAMKRGKTSKRNRPTTRDDMLLKGWLTCGGCGHAMTRHDSGANKFWYACNTVKRSRGGGCDNPRHRDFRVHQAVHKMLMVGIHTSWEKVRQAVPESVTKFEALEDHAEREDLIARRDRIHQQHERGWLSDDDTDARLAPILERLQELEPARSISVTRARSLADLDELRDLLQHRWSSISLAEQQQVIRAYVPGGFKLYKQVITGVVAGKNLEWAIEAGEPSRSNVVPGWAGTVEVARLLGKHENTVNLWARNGKIPAVRLRNGKYRIPEQALVRVGDSFSLAPDAWERCRDVVNGFNEDDYLSR